MYEQLLKIIICTHLNVLVCPKDVLAYSINSAL